MRKAQMILEAKQRHSNVGTQIHQVESLDSLEFPKDS